MLFWLWYKSFDISKKEKVTASMNLFSLLLLFIYANVLGEIKEIKAV